jgi:hypothetical protein
MKLLFAGTALIIGIPAGWVAGLMLYQFVYVSLFRHSASSRDIEAMGFWLSLATAMTVPLARLPVIALLNRRVSHASHRAMYALIIGMALGPIPAGLLALIWGNGNVSAVFTRETALAAVWAAFMGSGLMAPAAWFADLWFSPSGV